MSNLYLRFQACFPVDRQQPFLIGPEGEQLSYQALEERSAQLAQLFVSLGLQKGDRIAAQVAKSPMAILVYLASLRAGLIYLPLNTGYTESEMRYFIDDAEPRLLLCDPSQQSKMAALLAAANSSSALLTMDQLGAGSLAEAASDFSVEFATVDCDDDDIAAILYTSGTTGQPKGAMLSHQNLAANALTLKAMWGWQSSDVLLHALPIFHVHGLFVACHCVLAAGASMIFLPSFDVAEVIEALPKATVMMGVPTFYTRLLADANFKRANCNNMRLFISGSAPLLASTHQAFFERTGQHILERYGMTETGMLVSNPLQGERRAGTVGFPLPEVMVRIVDSNNLSVSGEAIGSIQVKGPNVFKGYWRKPEKTAQEFTADGYFITGDQGFLSADGYIAIVGRAKDMVISGGFNVYPKEVELVLDKIDGVKESAVIGLPHVDFGEAVTAVVVLDYNDSVDEQAIRAIAKQQLAAYKVPKKICVVDALPRNTMGKVQKNILREQFGTLYSIQ